ncbi:cofactor-independent phosphoglycerate mutase [uncultured Methanobrevibacter sp.]|uniref:cofactor-independent phosphoglycerate mutase n=1 Tax=uncultured Methanobrevibacter sp. TaxID=253161 RepID=UPI0025F7D0EA|nr:cofactor-independent phosphoglycerate mutase [uncultured Methanobrevibacter sp.]
MKYVIVIEDGASDYPIEEIDGKTPLKIANKPVLDRIAREGKTGLIQNVPESLPPGSDVANMSIFGYDPLKYYTGRGPLEAASMGVETKEGDVVFRCNTITERDGLMASSNAGHISSEESAELMEYLNEYFNDKYPDFKGKFYPGVSYRHLFVYNDNENAEKLAKLDMVPPHDFVGETIEDKLEFDSFADEVKAIMLESKEALADHPVNQKRIEDGKEPCNMVWFWGQGTMPDMPKMDEVYGLKGAVITGVDLIKGLGVCSGCTNLDVPGATAFFDTDYKAKGEYAVNALEDNDIVFVHVEAPDEAGHAKDLKEKVKGIENIDKWILEPLMEALPKYGDFKIAVLPDHPTPIDVGTHTRDMVPIAIYSSKDEADAVSVYDEDSVKNGALGELTGCDLLNLLLE